jgi:hypothetical protein
MKQGEVQIYKNIGTIQMALNDEGEKCYVYTHFFEGRSYEEDTIKGAKEMLDYTQRQAEEIQQAIRVLSRHNYRVFKEVA